MPENVKEVFDKALEFCRENQQIIMMVGAGVLALIILIAIIRGIVKSSGKKDDLDFDEEEYIKSLVYKNKKNRQQAPQPAEQLPESSESVAPAVPAPLSETIEPAGPAPLAEAVPQAVPVTVAETLSAADIPDVTAELPADNIQEIEIKIKSAEMRLKYADRSEDGSVVIKEKVRQLDGENFSLLCRPDAPAPAAPAVLTGDAVKDVSPDDAISVPPAETAAQPEPAAAQPEPAEQGLQSEEQAEPAEDPLPAEDSPVEQDMPAAEGLQSEQPEPAEQSEPKPDKPEAARRFGPENFNVARTGKIFTEEELIKQIRD